MVTWRLFVLFLAAWCLVACVPRDFPYYVMTLEGDIVPVEYGLPEDLDTRGVDEFPVRYELRRSGYTVHAAVDQSAHSPTFVFWATDSSLAPLAVSGKGIRCVGGFRPLLDNDPMKQKYPFAYHEFTWVPACSAVIPDEAFQGEIVLDINGSDGTPIREIILFRVVRNGTKRVYDAI